MDPIERVQHGMRVVDATGSSVGTVAEVRFGDREARHSGSAQAVSRRRAELLERIGYVKVDTGGLSGDDSYFSADDIIAVQRDTVHITRRAG
jgi:hypothetical protein